MMFQRWRVVVELALAAIMWSPTLPEAQSELTVHRLHPTGTGKGIC